MSQLSSENPSAQEADRPRKRQKTKDRNYRERSPLSRRRENDRWRPNQDRARDSHHSASDHQTHDVRNIRDRSMSPGRRHAAESETHPKSKKSRKDRKQNPSTQIRSLRNLLKRDNLPATVQQEKERELAALLFDQQKQTIKQEGKKNLKRYHFVRFVERQKASRTVKQLKKLQEQGKLSEDQETQLHEAEVDMNYAIYAPLSQKYISIYARDDSTDGRVRPLPRNLSKMRKADYKLLSTEQQHQIEEACMDAANTVSLAGGAKPPMWYVVESKMKEGEKALEALRNQQNQPDTSTDLVVGAKTKEPLSWLNDDGMIDPADLDSDSDEDDGGAAVNIQDEDDEMSDGDGGFFEHR